MIMILSSIATVFITKWLSLFLFDLKDIFKLL